MSKKPPPERAPIFWAGGSDDPVFHLDLIADAVIDGVEPVLSGVVLPPLHRWFRRPMPADLVARLFCHCGAGPIATVQRVWQPGSETVALIEYRLRRLVDRREETTLHRAVLHRETARCTHGPNLLHADDELVAYCGNHVARVPGTTVVDALRQVEGGWFDRGPNDPPRPRRVALKR